MNSTAPPRAYSYAGSALKQEPRNPSKHRSRTDPPERRDPAADVRKADIVRSIRKQVVAEHRGKKVNFQDDGVAQQSVKLPKIRADSPATKDVRSIGLGYIPRDKKVELDFPLEKFSPKGRTLRKAFERPRPDLPSDAPENRSRKPVTVTLPTDLIAEINAQCRQLDVDRTAFIEAAIRQVLKPS